MTLALTLPAAVQAAELDRPHPKKGFKTHSMATFRRSRGLAAA